MDRFVYFMVRVRHPGIGEPADALSGVIERLGVGEKKSFATANQLFDLIMTWPGESSSVQQRAEQITPLP
jgi:hypothetical protein